MRRLSWVVFSFTFFFYFLLFKTTSSSKTPVTTCCPPGSFLVIEDSQQSRQLPNGLWVASDTITPTGSMLALYNWWLGAYEEYGRHNYNLRVSCEPDKNNLPPIDGFRGSSHPNPPYFASVDDKMRGRESTSKPLADNQVLQSTGQFLASFLLPSPIITLPCPSLSRSVSQ